MEEQILPRTPCVAISRGSIIDFTSTIIATELVSSCNADGVSITVPEAVPDKKFSYTPVKKASGLPASMEIYENKRLAMIVDFPCNYEGRPYKYENSGKHYIGSFINGKTFY